MGADSNHTHLTVVASVLAELDVRRGDRILIMLPDGPGFVEAVTVITQHGGVAIAGQSAAPTARCRGGRDAGRCPVSDSPGRADRRARRPRRRATGDSGRTPRPLGSRAATALTGWRLPVPRRGIGRRWGPFARRARGAGVGVGVVYYREPLQDVINFYRRTSGIAPNQAIMLLLHVQMTTSLEATFAITYDTVALDCHSGHLVSHQANQQRST